MIFIFHVDLTSSYRLQGHTSRDFRTGLFLGTALKKKVIFIFGPPFSYGRHNNNNNIDNDDDEDKDLIKCTLSYTLKDHFWLVPTTV